MQVSASNSLPTRLAAWAQERFPAANLLLCLVLYGAALCCGRAAAGQGAIAISWRDGLGYLATYASLLMLRIYDEHKDYEIDSRNHPQRVLQRGLITLRHLKVLGALAIAVQLGSSLWLDHGFGDITWRWLLVGVYSALMAKEFFVGAWLSRHLILYAISHMVVLPMAVLWLAQIGVGQGPLPASAYLLALVALFSGFSFEIGRKTRAPEDERPTVDSYSKIMGVRGAVATLSVLSLFLGAALIALLLRLSAPSIPVAGIVIALIAAVLPFFALRGFLKAPSSKNAKLIEAVIALQTLIAYVLCAGTLIAMRGVTWT